MKSRIPGSLDIPDPAKRGQLHFSEVASDPVGKPISLLSVVAEIEFLQSSQGHARAEKS
jgi:hypothetical protein